MGPTPLGGGAEVVETARRVPRSVDPQAQRTRRVGGVDGIEANSPLGIDRDGHGAASGQQRTHRVGRIGHGRVEHGVATRSTELEPLGRRGHELLGADARADLGRRVDGRTEVTLHPAGRGRPQARRTERRGIATLHTGRTESRNDLRRRWVAGCADRQIHRAAAMPGGEGAGATESVLGIGRWNESRAGGGCGRGHRPSTLPGQVTIAVAKSPRRTRGCQTRSGYRYRTTTGMPASSASWASRSAIGPRS